jgi:hypothetical protein
MARTLRGEGDMRRIIMSTIALSLLSFAGCKSSGTYVKAMDVVGFEKRDMLKDRLQEARDSQVEAKQQLQTALYTLRRIESVPPTELSGLHDDLDTEVGKTEDEINDYKSDIAAVEAVAKEMFADWEEDLAKYDDAELREKSMVELRDTRRNYSALIADLRETERKLSSVLPALKDQVLYVEHSVNAGQRPDDTDKLDEVREQISTLIEDLEGSIDRTQRFIEEGIEASA